MKFKRYILFFVCIYILSISNIFAYDTIKDTYYYTSIDIDNLEDKFIYSDEYFSKSSFIGNNDLEILSIQTAGASASSYKNDNEAYNIIDMLKKMKFNNISTNKYYDNESEENSIAVTLASKTITVDNKEYTLLAIIPRSAGYDLEWAGNFYTGNEGIHLGFKLARDEVLRFTKEYINKNNIKGNIKVWLAGRSRAGAVSNMVGAFLADGGIYYFDNNISITPEDIYCYTFATPRTIKNEIDKNIELSVSSDIYKNDTKGREYIYNKGGIVDLKSDKYNGIKNIVSLYDLVTYVPLESWNYYRYGKDYIVNQNKISDKDMINELNNINIYAYNMYIKNGNPNTFKNKTFDLSSLSIIDENDRKIDAKTFINNKALALKEIVNDNKTYVDDDYQNTFMSLAATFGMSMPVLEVDNIDLSTLIYVYIDYAKERLKEEGINKKDSEVISLIIGDLLNYYNKEKIDINSYTLDDFIKLSAKYIADNDNSVLSNNITSFITNLVPSKYKIILASFKMFKTDNIKNDDNGIKAFIKACYYGPDKDSNASKYYKSDKEVRRIIYSIVPLILKHNLPNVAVKFKDNIKFETFVSSILKDTDNEDISKIADDKFNNLLDNMFNKIIINSESAYGIEYKNKLSKYVNNLKNNPKLVRKIITYIIFYNNKNYSSSDDLISLTTFINNASIIPLAHSNEVYLSYAKASKKYNNLYEENISNKKSMNDKIIYISLLIICLIGIISKLILTKIKKD